jgi:hypothetical protein
MIAAICSFWGSADAAERKEPTMPAEPVRKAPRNVLFAVGRLDKRGTRIIFLQPPPPPPIPGPWELRGICRA